MQIAECSDIFTLEFKGWVEPLMVGFCQKSRFYQQAQDCCRYTKLADLQVLQGLSVSTFDIVCRFLMLRGNKHIGGIGVFNHFAHQHEDTLLAGATRLCHVVRYDQD